MASSYVNDLRLDEMATGDASGTWGTVTNTNLELIAEAFSYGTENLGSDANTTITVADGATDEARSLYLKVTSTSLSADRTVTLAPNTLSKVWVIENATTGGKAITIKQGTGATIDIPNGDVKMVATDGAGSGGAVYDLLVDLNIATQLTIKNPSTSDDTPATLLLQTGDTDIAADDKLGVINFQAPDEGAGTDSILVAAGIEAVSEGDFSSSNNATKLSFKTASSEAAAEKMSLSSAGLLTIADDLMIKDGGTIGVASTNDAITISSAGIVTFKDDILIKDAGTIGSASDPDAISIASGGDVSFTQDITIKDGGTIGSASDADAITIASGGDVAFSQDITIKDAGTIGSATTASAIAISSTGSVTVNNSATDTSFQPFALQRDTNSNGSGVSLVFNCGDSGSATAGHGYARMFGAIEDNTNGSEDGRWLVQCSLNGTLTEHFRIASDGTLTGTDTTIGSNSDSRLKENISDYAYDLAKFKQLAPKSFDWKNPQAHGNKSGVRGFLAQDVNSIDDYWISKTTIESDDADASLIPDDSDGIKRPYTSKLTEKDAMYVSVIKQLIAKIETLETKVSALEGGG